MVADCKKVSFSIFLSSILHEQRALSFILFAESAGAKGRTKYESFALKLYVLKDSILARSSFATFKFNSKGNATNIKKGSVNLT